jgi:hypothetical protein
MARRKQRIAVVGGGFIGSEIAAALAMNDQDVVMIFPEQGIGGLLFPADLARFLNAYYRDRGVEVLNGRLVEGLAKQDGQTVLKLDDQSTVAVDSARRFAVERMEPGRCSPPDHGSTWTFRRRRPGGAPSGFLTAAAMYPKLYPDPVLGYIDRAGASCYPASDGGIDARQGHDTLV